MFSQIQILKFLINVSEAQKKLFTAHGTGGLPGRPQDPGSVPTPEPQAEQEESPEATCRPLAALGVLGFHVSSVGDGGEEDA